MSLNSSRSSSVYFLDAIFFSKSAFSSISESESAFYSVIATFEIGLDFWVTAFLIGYSELLLSSSDSDLSLLYGLKTISSGSLSSSSILAAYFSTATIFSGF